MIECHEHLGQELLQHIFFSNGSLLFELRVPNLFSQFCLRAHSLLLIDDKRTRNRMPQWICQDVIRGLNLWSCSNQTEWSRTKKMMMKFDVQNIHSCKRINGPKILWWWRLICNQSHTQGSKNWRWSLMCTMCLGDLAKTRPGVTGVRYLANQSQQSKSALLINHLILDCLNVFSRLEGI